MRRPPDYRKFTGKREQSKPEVQVEAPERKRQIAANEFLDTVESQEPIQEVSDPRFQAIYTDIDRLDPLDNPLMVMDDLFGSDGKLIQWADYIHQAVDTAYKSSKHAVFASGEQISSDILRAIDEEGCYDPAMMAFLWRYFSLDMSVITEEQKQTVGDVFDKSIEILAARMQKRQNYEQKVLDDDSYEEETFIEWSNHWRDIEMLGTGIEDIDERINQWVSKVSTEKEIPLSPETLARSLYLGHGAGTGIFSEYIENSKRKQEHLHFFRKQAEEASTVFERDNARRILYRSDFAFSEVVDGVVEYLGEEIAISDKEITTVRRITRDGKVGLFSETGELKGFFEVGDVQEHDTVKQAQITEIERQMVFADPNTPDTLRQQFLQDYKRFFEETFENERGIKLNDLSLREQLWVYEFWKNHPEKWKNFGDVKAEFGLAGITALMSAEQFSELTEKIIEVAKFDSSGLYRSDINLYASAISSLDSIEEIITSLIADNRMIRDDMPVQVAKEIGLRAGRELMKQLYTRQEHDQNYYDAKRMEKLNKEAVAFAGVFKTLAKGNDKIDFAQIVGLDMRVFDPEALGEKERQELERGMEQIVAANWEKQDSQAAQKVIEGFKEHLKEPGVEFDVLKKDGKVIAFVGYTPDPENPGHAAAHSFNVDPKYRGAAIGEAMMVNSLKRAAEKWTLHATAHPSIPIGTRYVDDIGFSFTGVVRDYEGTGVDFYTMEANKKENERTNYLIWRVRGNSKG